MMSSHIRNAKGKGKMYIPTIGKYSAFSATMMQSTIRHILACCFLFSSAYSFCADNEPIFKPVVDARDFIDVWQLRNDVALVPNRAEIGDTDFCGTEGEDYVAVDMVKPPSAKEIRRREKEAQQAHVETETCVNDIYRRTAEYERIFLAFNRAWLPVMMNAMRKGDKVAEVILRQCDTTPAFDRSVIENTCDNNLSRRDAAERRLTEIGFSPALQTCIGNGIEFPRVHVTDYPRAFTFYRSPSHSVWNTDSFACLSLHRQSQVPGYMTWGRELFYGGGNNRYSGLNIVRPSTEMIDQSEAEINRYLKQDPRWQVFLLTRIGRHEWVPEGEKSNTHILEANWLGEWNLEKATYGLATAMSPHKGRAVIARNGEFTQISIQSETPQEPLLDVTNCTLRYSGGSTYNYNVDNETGATHTSLGYFGTGKINSETLAPLDTHKRYKQVLMQCSNAEADDNSRVRFLLLAENTLVEVGFENSRGKGVAIRHYRRVK
jgi:hypothetical protein